MKRIISKLSKQPRYFTIDLDALMAREDHAGEVIPLPINKCIKFLLKYGSRSEGLFREPGSNSRIQELKKAFDSGVQGGPEFHADDVYNVASLLKLYLRDLPDPITKYDNYTAIVDGAKALSAVTKSAIVDLLNSIFRTLSKNAFALLHVVCHFLKLVALNSEHTRMKAYNLGIVFGPVFFRSPVANMAALKDVMYLNRLTEAMIENYVAVFEMKERTYPYIYTIFGDYNFVNQIIRLEEKADIAPPTTQSQQEIDGFIRKTTNKKKRSIVLQPEAHAEFRKLTSSLHTHDQARSSTETKDHGNNFVEDSDIEITVEHARIHTIDNSKNPRDNENQSNEQDQDDSQSSASYSRSTSASRSPSFLQSLGLTESDIIQLDNQKSLESIVTDPAVSDMHREDCSEETVNSSTVEEVEEMDIDDCFSILDIVCQATKGELQKSLQQIYSNLYYAVFHMSEMGPVTYRDLFESYKRRAERWQTEKEVILDHQRMMERICDKERKDKEQLKAKVLESLTALAVEVKKT